MIINPDNYLILSIQHYQGNLSAGMEEFEDDLKRVHYIKRLLKRYERTGEVPSRLLINHFIVLYNTFGSFATTMLWYRMPELQCYIKPIAQFLNRLPAIIRINGMEILTDDIDSDAGIVSLLKGI